MDERRYMVGPDRLYWGPDPDWDGFAGDDGEDAIGMTRAEYGRLRAELDGHGSVADPGSNARMAQVLLGALRGGGDAPFWAGADPASLEGRAVRVAYRSGRHAVGRLELERDGLFEGCLTVGGVAVLRPDGAGGVAPCDNVEAVEQDPEPDAGAPGTVDLGRFRVFRPDLTGMRKLQALKVLEEAAEFAEASKRLIKGTGGRADMLDEMADLLQSTANMAAAFGVSDGEIAAARARCDARNAARHRFGDEEAGQFAHLESVDRGLA